MPSCHRRRTRSPHSRPRPPSDNVDLIVPPVQLAGRSFFRARVPVDVDQQPTAEDDHNGTEFTGIQQRSAITQRFLVPPR